ncbi:MAG TPA: LysM peptidoglycan-binding domain-containing protein, partial [Actinomycetota bacterium]|nr:LysM peptidoglycan-binding domain-containing protein [Actinomycetota bacterium]
LSIEGYLQRLRTLYAAGERVRWTNMGPSVAGWFRITDLSVIPDRRAHGSNLITRATVDLTLTEASDVGAASASPRSSSVAASSATPAGERRYSVRSGDTLVSISQQMYGTSSRWRDVAAVNGITLPRALSAGQVLRIPA